MLSNLLPLLLLSLSSTLASHQKNQHRAVKASTSPNPADEFVRSIPSGQVISNCKNSGDFALTFDDGVNSQSTVASYLAHRGAHGSFFANVNNFACIYDLDAANDLIARYKAGHLIGSFTANHDDITTMTAAQLNADIDQVETAFSKILGIRPAFFRPPFGNYDDASLAILTKRGYNVVTWDSDSGDDVGRTYDEILKTFIDVASQYPRPQLMISGEYEADVYISKVVPMLQKVGYKLVTVAECLGVNPYQVISTPGVRDDSWNCDVPHYSTSAPVLSSTSTSIQVTSTISTSATQKSSSSITNPLAPSASVCSVSTCSTSKYASASPLSATVLVSVVSSSSVTSSIVSPSSASVVKSLSTVTKTSSPSSSAVASTTAISISRNSSSTVASSTSSISTNSSVPVVQSHLVSTIASTLPGSSSSTSVASSSVLLFSSSISSPSALLSSSTAAVVSTSTSSATASSSVSTSSTLPSSATDLNSTALLSSSTTVSASSVVSITTDAVVSSSTSTSSSTTSTSQSNSISSTVSLSSTAIPSSTSPVNSSDSTSSTSALGSSTVASSTIAPSSIIAQSSIQSSASVVSATSQIASSTITSSSSGINTGASSSITSVVISSALVHQVSTVATTASSAISSASLTTSGTSTSSSLTSNILSPTLSTSSLSSSVSSPTSTTKSTSASKISSTLVSSSAVSTSSTSSTTSSSVINTKTTMATSVSKSVVKPTSAPTSVKATSTTPPTKTFSSMAVSGTVITTCLKPSTIAMTYDDGPYDFGSNITTLLESYGALGTMFINGNNWGCIYDYADMLIERYLKGHQIASHTWTHVDITTISAAKLNHELDLVEEALMKILGIKPTTFRPPYGAYDDASVAVLTARGYNVVTWSLDSEDWRGASPADAIKVYSDNLKTFPAPQISLNHETYSNTANVVMPAVIPMLIAKGYKLVTISECLGIPAYYTVGPIGKRDSTWTCSGTP